MKRIISLLLTLILCTALLSGCGEDTEKQVAQGSEDPKVELQESTPQADNRTYEFAYCSPNGNAAILSDGSEESVSDAWSRVGIRRSPDGKFIAWVSDSGSATAYVKHPAQSPKTIATDLEKNTSLLWFAEETNGLFVFAKDALYYYTADMDKAIAIGPASTQNAREHQEQMVFITNDHNYAIYVSDGIVVAALDGSGHTVYDSNVIESFGGVSKDSILYLKSDGIYHLNNGTSTHLAGEEEEYDYGTNQCYTTMDNGYVFVRMDGELFFKMNPSGAVTACEKNDLAPDAITTAFAASGKESLLAYSNNLKYMLVVDGADKDLFRYEIKDGAAINQAKVYSGYSKLSELTVYDDGTVISEGSLALGWMVNNTYKLLATGDAREISSYDPTTHTIYYRKVDGTTVELYRTTADGAETLIAANVNRVYTINGKCYYLGDCESNHFSNGNLYLVGTSNAIAENVYSGDCNCHW